MKRRLRPRPPTVCPTCGSVGGWSYTRGRHGRLRVTSREEGRVGSIRVYWGPKRGRTMFGVCTNPHHRRRPWYMPDVKPKSEALGPPRQLEPPPSKREEKAAAHRAHQAKDRR